MSLIETETERLWMFYVLYGNETTVTMRGEEGEEGEGGKDMRNLETLHAR